MLRVRAVKVCGKGKDGRRSAPRQVFRPRLSRTCSEEQPERQNNTTHTTMESETPPKLLHLPYVKGVSERIEKMCRPLGVKTVMKTADTLRSRLVKVKQAIPSTKKKGVIYEIPCKDCPRVYIGETGRTLEKRLSEHKAAVKKNDPKNGIAVHAWANQHQVNWEAASVKQEERIY